MNKQVYYFIVITVSLLLELIISPVIPMLVTFISQGISESVQTFDYFTMLTRLKIVYLGIPIYLLTLALLRVKGEMLLWKKVAIPVVYGFINLVTAIIFVFLIQDFKDLFGVRSDAPYLGFFYFSVIGSFISSAVVAKIVNMVAGFISKVI